MIEVRVVQTKKEQKEFLNFPLKLYKGCKYYSPALYLDEKNLFKKDYFYYKSSEAIYFNAYKDGKMVGRIGGILQKQANSKWNQKRVRFTRFDLIDDLEVGKALLNKVEEWAKEKGMEEVFGPMGFSDMEREGLLVEGFDEPTTYSENYNYEYYKTILEKLGYSKDVDWIANQISDNPDLDLEKIERIVNMTMAKYHLKYGEYKNTNELLDKYGKKFFDIVEEAYKDLYQTVPFLDEQIEDMIKSFKLIISKEYVTLVVDENGDVAAFGLAFPFIADILNETGGRLYPHILPKLFHRIKHAKVVELGLIGVGDKYRKTGISWAPMLTVAKQLRSGNVKYCETNLNLETNTNIINMLDHVTRRQHRRVRTYIKKLQTN